MLARRTADEATLEQQQWGVRGEKRSSSGSLGRWSFRGDGLHDPPESLSSPSYHYVPCAHVEEAGGCRCVPGGGV